MEGDTEDLSLIHARQTTVSLNRQIDSHTQLVALVSCELPSNFFRLLLFLAGDIHARVTKHRQWLATEAAKTQHRHGDFSTKQQPVPGLE
ncbi:hypothetical protein F441_08604 [Phytophthora nicotianae CJ01A1]|uniref:Uncharacterized protein n=3 Tax=Phytophthora nicotianae TaxID=4792 RepID=V9F6E6_PHYNI|nr:hypothetical protein F443_08627 [Phytophthora nicotianae P1569]ETL40424.1 hypothetical protein L916_08392 [Phytophthora nicotianae]ETP16875.1 hypothetical protein F441_08604 [Phytophthora nicotianae CJ01A1]